MMRLNPCGSLKLLQADTLQISYAGSEANVAVSLANFGMEVSFVSIIANNELGQAAVNSLRKFGVDTSFILRRGDRLGLYFVEHGSSQRPSKVIYDRKNSSITKALRGDFDWDIIFKGTEWFHFSGITPALGENIAAICLQACIKAKEKGIKVSCDLNYRNKLWTTDKARQVMTKLMDYVDICIGNEEDAANVFGIKPRNIESNFNSIDACEYKYVAENLALKFNLEKVAFTLRESVSADRNIWSGLLFDGRNVSISNKYDINIVDRFGAGDSFSAGIIYSLLSGASCEEAVNFAAGASCLKQTMEYDFNLTTVDDVRTLLNGNNTGRVQR